MKLNTTLRKFLLREHASVRLLNTLIGRYGQQRSDLTLAQFIKLYPLERLRKEIYGFGPKAQAELLALFDKVTGPFNLQFANYCATLRPKKRPAIPDERTCVYCGCTDSRACAGGCSWVVTWQYGNVGVCSNCIAPHRPFQIAIEPMIKTKNQPGGAQ